MSPTAGAQLHWQASVPCADEPKGCAFPLPMDVHICVHAAAVTVPVPPEQKQFVSFGCASTREPLNPAALQRSLHAPAGSFALSSSDEHAESAVRTTVRASVVRRTEKDGSREWVIDSWQHVHRNADTPWPCDERGFRVGWAE